MAEYRFLTTWLLAAGRGRVRVKSLITTKRVKLPDLHEGEARGESAGD